MSLPLQAAQEKEELQRKGDDLDAKIRKAEKEIRALENTLRLMNNRNETYRKSFSKVSKPTNMVTWSPPTNQCEIYSHLVTTNQSEWDSHLVTIDQSEWDQKSLNHKDNAVTWCIAPWA